MALRGTKLVASDASRVTICIDDTSEYEYSGRIYSPYLPEIVTFTSVMHMIDILETFFDDINYPQAYYATRNFDKPQSATLRGADVSLTRYHQPGEEPVLSGKHATFLLHVRFRHNATWQGSVKWVEQDESHDFRSILEFIKISNQMLSETV
ncbi:hypothetical protein LJC63_02665 [Ruminococcaceae bacterium OttesenSCG-928-L11]|nr:hypothetical protein [Ruminococcaceae bacterium OttesenSCG-928-L11]